MLKGEAALNVPMQLFLLCLLGVLFYFKSLVVHQNKGRPDRKEPRTVPLDQVLLYILF